MVENKTTRRVSTSRKKRKTKNRFPSTSKLILAVMGVVYVGIIIFACYEMHIQQNLDSLYVLVGIPAAASPVLWGYFSKSKVENSAGGIVYDMAMANIETDESASG